MSNFYILVLAFPLGILSPTMIEQEYTDYRPAVKVKRSSAGLGLFADEDIKKDTKLVENLVRVNT